MSACMTGTYRMYPDFVSSPPFIFIVYLLLFSFLFTLRKKNFFNVCYLDPIVIGRSIGILNMDRGLRSRAPFKWDKTRLEGNTQIGGTGTRLLLYSPIAWENPGKSGKKPENKPAFRQALMQGNIGKNSCWDAGIFVMWVTITPFI